MNTELSCVLPPFDVLQLMTGPSGIDDGRVAVFGRAAPLGLSGINRTGTQGYATVVLLPPLHPGLTEGRAFGRVARPGAAGWHALKEARNEQNEGRG